jgi:hypothetical protein
MNGRFSRRARTALALSAAAGAIIAAAAIASAVSAAGSHRTLRLLATAQQGVGFKPSGAPQQGDRIGGGSKITGDDKGVQRSVCTVIGTKALCNLQLVLSKGELTAQGLVPTRFDHSPIVITGGNGAYEGAQGTAYATQATSTKIRFTVKLRR